MAIKALEIKDLYKVYGVSDVALKGIDLSVESGDFFALLGPNGAGKTTTIGIVTDLVRKTSGSISIFGFDIEKNKADAKACIGVVPQEFNFNLFERVIDIVVNQAGYYGLPRRIALTRAEKYLTALGLWDKRYAVSRTLSGGMKRRLMIARALMHEPQMLILDEPTAGVDIELRRSMWRFLEDLNKAGKTVILTTHYLEEAESLCRSIAIIHQGRMIENTSMKTLLSRLQTESIIVDLKHPLFEKPDLPSCQITLKDEVTLEITFPKTFSLNSLFDCLSKKQIEVLSMRNKSNRLEELFVQLVEGV